MRYFPLNRCASGCSVFHSCADVAHTFSRRQPSGDHGPGARDSHLHQRHAFAQEGRLCEKGSPHGRGDADPAVWTVRRLYALWVPAALNLIPNSARFTFTCCFWMGCMSTASMGQHFEKTINPICCVNETKTMVTPCLTFWKSVLIR